MNTELPTSRPIKVGILIATLGVGGAERMALAVARALLDVGMDVRFYCIDPVGNMPLPGTPEQQQELAERITVLNTILPKSTLQKALAFPRTHWRFRRLVQQHQLDLVISFMERANILNLLGTRKVARIISIRKHLSMALADKDALKRSLVKAGYSVLLGRADNINLNSAEAAEDLQQLFPGIQRVSVINNFYDQQMQQKAQQQLPPEALAMLQGNSVLTCGRLVKVKRQDALIRAFAHATRERPDTRLVIVGDGPERQRLQQLIDRLGMQQRIHLAGFQANPYAWVGRCSVFVLSSRSEGFPNALLEAMALGRPVISADCRSGPRELLAPDTRPSQKTGGIDHAAFGVLTAPLEDRPNSGETLTAAELSLADAIKTLLEDSGLQSHYRQQALLRAGDFSRDTILDQWVKLVVNHTQCSDQ